MWMFALPILVLVVILYNLLEGYFPDNDDHEGFDDCNFYT